MSLFRNILVYAEAADADCLAEVAALAEQSGAALSVCDVIAPAPARDAGGAVGRLKALDWSLAFERLRGLCAPHQGRVPLDYAVLTGNPFLAVTEQVTRQGFDLVVHISETTADAPGAALNPTGMHLVRKCPAAVWTLHPARAPGADGLLLAVDRELTAANDGPDRFARELATTACAMAAARGAPLHLVHAWQPYGEALLDHPRAGLSPTDVASYLADQEADHAAWFGRLADDVAAGAPGVVIERHLERGAPVTTIPRLARKTGAALVVLGTVGTS
ncbi:MAG TPA: universal stress protein, partial [Pseudohaliea sp.]|nr:universal stress protein [Pseudohaliea sp.]